MNKQPPVYMARIKASSLRQESLERVRELLLSKRRELQSSRFLAAGGKLKDVKKIRTVRKDIARILTVLKEKELT